MIVTRLFPIRLLFSPPLPKRALFFFLVFLSCLVLFADRSFAWIYPEHRDITVLTVEKLDPGQRVVLDGLWAEARAGHEGRLCEKAADAGQGEKPSCIDWAAWPAIAGDHACSAENMVQTVLETDWILAVAAVAAELKQKLAKAKNRPQHVNYLRDSDIKLQRADKEYATRAGSNNVHFLLARRPTIDADPGTYVRRCLVEGAELNALGAYAWYHLSALEKAARLARGGLGAEQRSALALAVLADEAFALHFLEDSYASGHVAGTWGDASQRKGTHDYYNEYGLETMTWEGNWIILLGDAWMRSEDAERGAEAVRKSLAQVLEAAAGRGPTARHRVDKAAAPAPDAMNVCELTTMPPRKAQPGIRPLFGEVMETVPVPALEPGLGSLPRFRAELGSFIGLSTAAYGKGVDGGFGATQTTAGGIAGLELALRLGLGLEGVLNEAGDGLVFLDLGVRLDSASTMDIADDPALAQYGAISAAIPSRSAYTARLRMPFWLIPGDLILALPVLLFSPDTYAKMAVISGNGGLIPWQSGIATPIGRFQFVLGREVGIGFYGYGKEEDRLIIPPSVPSGSATLIGLRSMSFDFPIVEYRPFRTFSLDQSSGLVVQFYGGLDIPRHTSVIAPSGAPEPHLKTIWYGGIRIVFDWRSYF